MKLMEFSRSLWFFLLYMFSESRIDVPIVPRSGQTHLLSTDPIYSIPILIAGGHIFVFFCVMVVSEYA